MSRRFASPSSEAASLDLEAALAAGRLFDALASAGEGAADGAGDLELLVAPGGRVEGILPEGTWLLERALGEGTLGRFQPLETAVLVPGTELAPGQALVRRGSGWRNLGASEVAAAELMEVAAPASPPIAQATQITSPGRQPRTEVPCPSPATVLDRFTHDRSNLAPAHQAIVEQLADEIAASQTSGEPVHTVCVEGHTDSTGTDAYNRDLGLRRAGNVQSALQAALDRRAPGLAGRLGWTPSSSGEARPVASNSTADGRARNRRVEVSLNRSWSQPVAPEPTTARIALVRGGEALVGEALGGADLFAESVPSISPATRAVIPVGTSATFSGTGSPSPAGCPGFVWTLSDPTVACLAGNGNPQASPNSATVHGLRPGTTNLVLTYRDSGGGTGTTQVEVVVVAIKVAGLLDPAGSPCDGRPIPLIRPLRRSGGVAHRAIKILLEPASFWSGQEVNWTFAAQGTVRGTLPAGHAQNLEAEPGFAFATATRRSTVSAGGTAAVRVNLPPVSLNRGQLTVASVTHSAVRLTLGVEVPGVVVVDAGHGGSANLAGSSSNNATSVSGVLEKAMTLDLATRVRDALLTSSRLVEVHLTRDEDFNVAGAERSRRAREVLADVLVSLHFNGNGDATIRGTETFVRANSNGNVNRTEDVALATRVLAAAVGAIPGGRSRGVKDDTQTAPRSLAVLSDTSFGNTAAQHPIRACLLEVEFITNATVDAQFNTNANRFQFKNRLARAIADAIVTDLAS